MTGSYTDDHGLKGKTRPAFMVPTYDPSADYQFEDGSIGPLGSPIVDKSISTTQDLRSNPLFTIGTLPIELIGVTTVQNGKDVNIIHKTKVTHGIRPVKSLLGPRPNFESFDGLKRQTSRTKEVIREHEESIAPEVTRLSYNRPDHLVKQARQQGDLMDAELGIYPPSTLPDDADLSK